MDDASLPAGPRAPGLLQLVDWVRRPIPMLESCHRRFGDRFTLRFPGLPPFVLFSDPESIRDIFAADPEDVPAGQANEVLRPILGAQSLLLLDGARHLRERRLLMPPFHGERMHAYGDIMRDITARVVAGWPEDRPFPIHPSMQRITMDVILRTVFGLEEGAAMDALRTRLGHLLGVISHPWAMLAGFLPLLQRDLGPLTPWAAMLHAKAEVDALIFAEIARRRGAPAAPSADVLGLLLAARHEDGQPMRDEQLRDELVTFLLAGHETTATALAWSFHCLLGAPEVLARVREELARVAGTGPLPAARASELPYLDAVVKESLRLRPILPLVARRLRRPLVLGGRALPAGVNAMPCIYLAHRRPEAWPDPERFLPERFLDGKPPAHAFFPFGGGARRCVGMAFALYEMKIVLGETLLRVALRPAPGPPLRVVRRSITLAPSEGMPVVAQRHAA